MLISIITINYNNLNGLKRTIESVVQQTWQEFEYIIIDGGSEDGSVEYLKSQTNNIDFWVSEPDLGVYNAMNKGIDKAIGEYLLFLNSGDCFISETVLKENYFKFTNYDLIYFNIEIKDKKSSRIISYPKKLNFSFFYLGTLCHQAVIIKKDLFRIVGLYDENLKLVSDWKFFIFALFKFNCSYTKVNCVLTTYYLDGISSDLVNRKKLYDERKHVLLSDFKLFIDEINELLILRKTVSSLRKSRKLELLVKLGLLNKF